MDAKTRRVLKAKQGRATAGSGEPSAGDGVEGEVQVREVNGKPTLFARLKNRWLQSPLTTGGSSFVPRAFTANLVLPSDSGKPCFVIPPFIPLRDILNISVLVETTAGSVIYFYQMPVAYHGIAANGDWLLTLKTDDRTLYLSRCGLTFQGKPAKLTIFYK